MAAVAVANGSAVNAVAGPSWATREAHIDKVISRPGPWTDESFEPAEVKTSLRSKCKTLVIGAGGLGCEILANLALTGFKEIHVIDMDEIDVSNLNRQFLFREKDVGRPKAVVAAEYVERRVPGVKIVPYHGKIQDKDDAYYMQFNIIICGLDSVEARRWINATVVNMAQVDPANQDAYKALIDGGTEGFKGQARVILPTITSCYECSLDLLNRQTTYPICTIANTPRLPEHCIEWASVLEWPRVHGDKNIDNDNPDHIQWLLEQASARAERFNITGVTWSLTQGVVKNIIPAIASTNAIVAAACTQEAFKFATTAAPFLNNYMMYSGNEGVYTYTYAYEKRKDCPVCGGESRELEIQKDWPIERLIEMLIETKDLQIKKPSLSGEKGPIYFQAPPQLEEQTRPNLTKTIGEMFEDGDGITVTDASLPFQLGIVLKFVA
ncbi:hypothetical protein K437DRAFT_220214 [Tilletiaria anomala UBC 951]|uniref:NEDD8-activating enzyme E1 catalytic subunit n=1 Tax=Tilletiaria anomala (strain ATCC 24038 / CBS 436.72 / UBC 951) TaxID=1037660 RepID=A0A066WP16_TILAU|nr:uncharacterized protein K437DRAFT_220214 [Tilletiaria anomala UBC 951]KDN52754.1 hypothetical protein K437DRAFT_220214 [Tilletiaria anomala UBC 951]